MLKIWGRATSSNVMKVVWACEEMRLNYQRIDIGGSFGGNREPKYLAINPNGLVPTIEDDGFVLWESNAIVRYLTAKHGAGGLWPNDLKVRADADRWMDWVNGVATPPMGAMLFGYYRTPVEKRDPAALEAARMKAIEAWTMAEAILAKRPFLAGDKLSIGDIAIGPHVHRWFSYPIERPNLPGLAAYYGRLKERPAYAKHIAFPVS
ncbi:MAG: glutathione S-transferase family protein [Proteobacteria bacterium]|nr:glutathione S-transferase family protein [Pseudomonadota bacterium]MBI3498006.1 glutathione S-transferase family protein [Pseudomonadota bacterium]